MPHKKNMILRISKPLDKVVVRQNCMTIPMHVAYLLNAINNMLNTDLDFIWFLFHTYNIQIVNSCLIKINNHKSMSPGDLTILTYNKYYIITYASFKGEL